MSEERIPPDDPLVEAAEAEIAECLRNGEAEGWGACEIEALRASFEKWLRHPRLLDPGDKSLLRVTVMNEITWLISDPNVGEDVWKLIARNAKDLGSADPYDLRECWRVTTFELAAEPPEVPWFLEKLFSLAGDEATRWAIFGAYENVPWRLRDHARKFSKGLISDDDCDQWLIDQGWGEDEILMKRSEGS